MCQCIATILLTPSFDTSRTIKGQLLMCANDDGYAARLGTMLVERSLTLAVAESLTAGLVTGTVAAIPGASKYLLGGVVTYATDAKGRILGVDERVLRDFGAVSEESVREMARGVSRLFQADVGLATSGVAGPDLQDGKPVGTLCLGVSIRGRELSCTEQLADQGRNAIRAGAVDRALRYLLNTLEDDAGRSL
jgi:PncC family amidohydrolase